MDELERMGFTVTAKAAHGGVMLTATKGKRFTEALVPDGGEIGPYLAAMVEWVSRKG